MQWMPWNLWPPLAGCGREPLIPTETHFLVVASQVEPKRIALAAAMAELKEVSVKVAKLQAQLKEVMDRLSPHLSTFITVNFLLLSRSLALSLDLARYLSLYLALATAIALALQHTGPDQGGPAPPLAPSLELSLPLSPSLALSLPLSPPLALSLPLSPSRALSLCLSPLLSFLSLALSLELARALSRSLTHTHTLAIFFNHKP